MLRFVWLSVLVVLLDQASKLWILENFREFEVVVVWPVFNLTLVFNEGAAFSFLADAGGWQQYLFSGLAMGVSVVLIVWLSCEAAPCATGCLSASAPGESAEVLVTG